MEFQSPDIAKRVAVIGPEQCAPKDRIDLLTLRGGEMDEWNTKLAY